MKDRTKQALAPLSRARSLGSNPLVEPAKVNLSFIINNLPKKTSSF
ncbi:hypothetical protein [Pseudobacteriovorax antillogorgiicola]|nr:hypothetical protein [Pseudobacteriovorax antillogorgiicola]